MWLSANDIKPFTLMNFNMKSALDLKHIIRMRISSYGTIFDHYLTNLMRIIYKLWLHLFLKLKVRLQPFHTMQTIMQVYCYNPSIFHRQITYPQQRKQRIHLLHCNRRLLINIIKRNSNHKQNRQQQQCNIIQSRVSIEHLVIVILFYKEIIILFYNHILVTDYFS